jgi:hypothetical protein
LLPHVVTIATQRLRQKPQHANSRLPSPLGLGHVRKHGPAARAKNPDQTPLHPHRHHSLPDAPVSHSRQDRACDQVSALPLSPEGLVDPELGRLSRVCYYSLFKSYVKSAYRALGQSSPTVCDSLPGLSKTVQHAFLDSTVTCVTRLVSFPRSTYSLDANAYVYCWHEARALLLVLLFFNIPEKGCILRRNIPF